MKFTCTRDNLAYALTLVSGLAGKQVNLPILHNIHIHVGESNITLTSTNLEIATKATFRAKIEQQGSFTIPAKTFIDYVQLLPSDQVHIELVDSELVIACGSSSTKIKGMPADEFPVVPDIDADTSYTVTADSFRDALSKVVFAAAKNEIRPELSGVYFGFFTERYDGLILAATDSFRLAEKKTSVAQGNTPAVCIVPAKTVQEMIKIIATVKGQEQESQVRLALSDNQLAFRFGQCELSSRLINGKYPNYAQIIPTEHQTSVTIPSDVLTTKIKAASIFASAGVNAVSFSVKPNEHTMDVASTSTQTGEHASTIDVEVSGEDVMMFLNYRYVLEGINHLDGDMEIHMNGKDAPCLLKEKGAEDYAYIVMPIRQ